MQSAGIGIEVQGHRLLQACLCGLIRDGVIEDPAALLPVPGVAREGQFPDDARKNRWHGLLRVGEEFFEPAKAHGRFRRVMRIRLPP